MSSPYPLFEARGGGSIVGMTFDTSVAWPGYDWMGVAKTTLEAVNRHLASNLGPHGVRANLVSAGRVDDFDLGRGAWYRPLCFTIL